MYSPCLSKRFFPDLYSTTSPDFCHGLNEITKDFWANKRIMVICAISLKKIWIFWG